MLSDTHLLYIERYSVLHCQASCDVAACVGSGERSGWGTAPDPSQGADRPLHPRLHWSFDATAACGGSEEWRFWGAAPDPRQGAGRPLPPRLPMKLDGAAYSEPQNGRSSAYQSETYQNYKHYRQNGLVLQYMTDYVTLQDREPLKPPMNTDTTI